MSTTPLGVDTYSRYMVDVFDERDIIGVPTGFQSLFGNPASGAKTVFSPNSEVVDIDILRGNERIAAMISRGGNTRSIAGQQNTSDQNYSSFSRVFPLGEEEGDISANQINKRIAGENPYDSNSKFDRMRDLAMEHHQSHIRRFVRMFEVLAAQSIITGSMDAILGTANTDLQYDFRRNAANTITPAQTWNSGTQTIMADIDGACDQVRENGHTTPDCMLVGSGAMAALIADTDMAAKADNRRFELVLVSTNNPVPAKFDKMVAAGFIARGRLRTESGYELWMFTYIDGYTNSAGTFTKYLDTDKAVIMNSQARFDRYFGPSEVMPLTQTRTAWYQENFGFSPTGMIPPSVRNPGGVVRPEMFYCDGYPSPNQKGVSIRTQTAPIFATTQTDAIATLQGLLT